MFPLALVLRLCGTILYFLKFHDESLPSDSQVLRLRALFGAFDAKTGRDMCEYNRCLDFIDILPPFAA